MILDSYLQISQGKSPSSRTIVDRHPWCPRADTQWRTRSRRRSACPQTAAVRRRARQPHRCGRTAGVRSRGGIAARGRGARRQPPAAAGRAAAPCAQRPDALAEDEPIALRQPGRAGGRPHFAGLAMRLRASARARGRCSPLARCTQKISRFWYVANKLLAVLCT